MYWTASKIFWLVVAPTNALLFLIAMSAAWAVIRNSKRAACIAFACACGLLASAFTPLGYWLASPLEDRFPPWNVNLNGEPMGIIILGGESGERITILAELSRRFPKARLAYSGPGNDASVTLLLRQFAALGGDPKRVMIERKSTNTFENADFSRDMIKPASAERWLLVTAAIHMPRAVGSFRKAGFNVEAFPTQYHTRGRLSLRRFLMKSGSDNLALVDKATKEWIGMAIYRLMGKTDALFPAP